MSEWRHSSDDLERVFMQANKIHGAITDYTEGIAPSVLYQAIFLTECERVMDLAPDVKRRLAALREEVAQAIGLR